MTIGGDVTPWYLTYNAEYVCMKSAGLLGIHCIYIVHVAIGGHL